MTEARIDPERDPIHVVAADWVVRLRQPDLSLDDTLRWQQWMSQDARHREVFHGLEVVWEKFDSVPVRGWVVAPEALKADTYDGSLPLSAWKPKSVRRHRPWQWVAAAVLLIALFGLVSGSLIAPAVIARVARGRTYETPVGHNATVNLADGSKVQLGGHTRLTVTLSPGLRRVDLLGGEAFFSVAKDPARPFQVHAGAATVTAVGTEFNIRRSDDRVVVSVLEGRVLVQPMVPVVPISWIPASRAIGSAEPVSAGQRSTVNRHGVESTQPVADASSAVEWQHGRLAFEGEPLRYVVQDVNRYSGKPIVIADEHTGNLQVTGTVTEANITGWINSLQAAFGIHADMQADQIVLQQK